LFLLLWQVETDQKLLKMTVESDKEDVPAASNREQTGGNNDSSQVVEISQ